MPTPTPDLKQILAGAQLPALPQSLLQTVNRANLYEALPRAQTLAAVAPAPLDLRTNQLDSQGRRNLDIDHDRAGSYSSATIAHAVRERVNAGEEPRQRVSHCCVRLDGDLSILSFSRA